MVLGLKKLSEIDLAYFDFVCQSGNAEGRILEIVFHIGQRMLYFFLIASNRRRRYRLRSKVSINFIQHRYAFCMRNRGRR